VDYGKPSATVDKSRAMYSRKNALRKRLIKGLSDGNERLRDMVLENNAEKDSRAGTEPAV
jgi:hypothetical protein